MWLDDVSLLSSSAAERCERRSKANNSGRRVRG